MHAQTFYTGRLESFKYYRSWAFHCMSTLDTQDIKKNYTKLLRISIALPNDKSLLYDFILLYDKNQEKMCSWHRHISDPGEGNKYLKCFYRCHFKSLVPGGTEWSLLTNHRWKPGFLTLHLGATHFTKVFLTAPPRTSLNILKISKWCYVSVASFNNTVH